MVDAPDPWHTRAKACVGTGWITTWPVATEAEAAPEREFPLGGTAQSA